MNIEIHTHLHTLTIKLLDTVIVKITDQNIVFWEKMSQLINSKYFVKSYRYRFFSERTLSQNNTASYGYS